MRLTDVTFVVDDGIPRKIATSEQLQPAGKLASFVLIRQNGSGLRAEPFGDVHDTAMASQRLGETGGIVGIPIGRHPTLGTVFRATRIG